MSSSPSPPAIANPSSVASTQTELNTTSGEQSQQGSMVNQYNPYGSLTYTQTGTSSNGTPLYSANESLSAPQQAELTAQETTGATAGNQAANLLQGANYGSTNPSTVIGNATSGTTEQEMAQEPAYLQPTFKQQTDQLDAQLQNEGFNPGTPGYQQAMNGLLQSQNQTTTGFLASIEPQMYSQAVQNYELPAELSGSLYGLDNPTNLTADLTSTPGLSISPANYEGDVATSEAAAQQTYQDQLQQQQAMMSGLFGIGSSVLGGLAKSGVGAGAMASLAAL